MAKAKKRKSKSSNTTVARFLRPTEAREAHNDFQSAGVAMRVIPVIVRLHKQDALSDEEFTALAYYRDQASLADRSPVRSCIDFSPRGGHGPGIAIQSAIRETARLERDMGQLASLCRAVCVDDTTIERWCEEKYGKINEYNVGVSILELKYAAGGIVR
jgi:hypothetical protein